jgi:hypothetical protein
LALPETDIEDIASLQRGTLGTPDPQLYSFPPPPLFADTESFKHREPKNSKVIAFNKKPARLPN